LRLIRKARGLTQTELGRLMRKHGYRAAQSTVCFREREKAGPCSEFVNAAAKALEVPPFLLFLPLNDCGAYQEIQSFIWSTSSAICGIKP
jgi:transcriptional regulator with XRE-family HTH domain